MARPGCASSWGDGQGLTARAGVCGSNPTSQKRDVGHPARDRILPMKDSPLFTVVFPAVWIVVGLAAILVIPAAIHHAYGGSFWGGLIEYSVPSVGVILYSIWRVRRERLNRQPSPRVDGRR